MQLFYITACLPMIIGLFLWLFDRKVVWAEWLIASASAFLIAGIMHAIAFMGMTDDIEMWSGTIQYVEHHPKWIEEYKKEHSRTVVVGKDSRGNNITRTKRWTTTEHDTHHEHWIAYASYGTEVETRNISQETYNDLKNKFGNQTIVSGKQSTDHWSGKFDGGDNNIYRTNDKTNYCQPVTKIFHFENRVKAAPTVFSFPKVPESIKLYKWPQNQWMHSNRLINENRIDQLSFDRFNSRLGPRKRINVIMINFKDKDSSIADWQQAKWIGGKKNDLVICYNQINNQTTWCKVFGWTESELCKRNIATILLQNPVNDDILPIIENEIRRTYQIKDWSKFDYISIEPPTWSYITFFVLLFVSQVGLWIFFHMNQYTKTNVSGKYITNRRRY